MCVYILVYTLIYVVVVPRTQLLSFHRILTALRRIILMLTWRTVGMPVHSSFSSAICVQSMEESQRTVSTKLDQAYTCIFMYMCVYLCIYVSNQCVPDDLLLELVFFNTFEELNLPIKGPMEDAGVVKLY